LNPSTHNPEPCQEKKAVAGKRKKKIVDVAAAAVVNPEP
jgi:hypothetical protein